MNFHWSWRWWDRIQVIFLNLLYFNLPIHQRSLFHLRKECISLFDLKIVYPWFHLDSCHMSKDHLFQQSRCKAYLTFLKNKQFIGKGGFFSESAIRFSNLEISKKKYPKKLSWTWNLNFLPKTFYCYWREIQLSSLG